MGEVNEHVKSYLQRQCMYTKPPFKYNNGHEFCPCITEAIRQAYIGGYKHGRAGTEPEVGRDAIIDSDRVTVTTTAAGDAGGTEGGKAPDHDSVPGKPSAEGDKNPVRDAE